MSAPNRALSPAWFLGSRAVEAPFAAAYPQLCRVARAHLRKGGRSAVLDTNSVVHGSYVRFAQASDVTFEGWVQFIGFLNRAKRTVPIDLAHRKVASRRGGGAPHVSLTEDEGVVAPDPEIVVRVHEALDKLAAFDEPLARVVELRCFAGMTKGEISATLDVTDRTVRRSWQKARLWVGEALRDR